jgi:peptide/nickel transport system substrate-binding protein
MSIGYASATRRTLLLCTQLLFALFFVGCSRTHPDASTFTMIIESSPANLDPRVGTDAQSERIDALLFDSLVRKDEHFNLKPWVAESWEIRDPLTYIFHIRPGVRFQDGRPLSARDVKWTIDSMLDGTVTSARAGAYLHIAGIDVPDEHTVIFHLKEPFSGLLWSLSNGAIGIVPYGSGKEFSRNPVGSGPFRLVRNEQDNEVVVERNDVYWAEKPRLARVRFAVVPDTTTRALELRKGSADAEINALTPDMVRSLRSDSTLRMEQEPGTSVQYVAFNLRDPALRDVRVRQAIAYAMDVRPLIEFLWRNMARPAVNILPPQHWAYDQELHAYPHDAAKARALLAEAGYSPAHPLHLLMKTSNTDETSRILAVVIQQQLRDIGIDLDVRTYEFATFYSDVVKGAFQMYTLRWVGGDNQDPNIFEYVFDSKSFPPRRANRSYYSNAEVDRLIAQGQAEIDPVKRRAIYAKIQEQLLHDLPYINLWYLDNAIVHSARVHDIHPQPAGDYDFLRTASLIP